MRAKLERRLCKRLAAFLPGHIVQCEFGADGIVAVMVQRPASGERWYVTGITMQSLIGQKTLDATVDQILNEISVARGGDVLLLTRQR